ncbi:MAG TPA: hypothetical protein PLF40_31915, partial [Kofleriaceae bacterium]|nr:hypothetical protein [Kofleriaceae bacterium]
PTGSDPDSIRARRCRRPHDWELADKLRVIIAQRALAKRHRSHWYLGVPRTLRAEAYQTAHGTCGRHGR